ncbi:MAG: hypothetical protein WKH64_04605 [Chloroflexia bacterium]
MDLCILRTEEGERRSRILSGVSAQTRFTDDRARDNDGAVVLDDREWRLPGEECVVRTVYSAPERAPFLVERVAPFVLRDGARIVVRGTVLGALGEPVREQLYTRRPVRQPGLRLLIRMC